MEGEKSAVPKEKQKERKKEKATGYHRECLDTTLRSEKAKQLN
jgi:hypothetical protein